MAVKKAHELLRKHNVSLQEVETREASLRHLRHIVRSEGLPFDVFRELVRLRK